MFLVLCMCDQIKARCMCFMLQILLVRWKVSFTTSQIESTLWPLCLASVAYFMFLVSSSWTEQMSRKKRRTRQIWTNSPSAPSRYSYPCTSRDCCLRVKKFNYLYMMFHVSCFMFRVSCFMLQILLVRWKVSFTTSQMESTLWPLCLASVACFMFLVSSSWTEQMSRKKMRTRQIWTHSPSAPNRYSYPYTSRDRWPE